MRLLIADDEFQIRTGLAEGIDWQALGFDTVLTAQNGVDAFDQCRLHHPEILITDIRMPGIDGLQLARQVMDLYSPVKVIILSGYSEFAYARESLKIGVVDYLLKPVDITELENKVAECAGQIRQEQQEQVLRQAYTRRQYQDILKQRMLLPTVMKTEEVTQLASYLGMPAQESCQIALVSVDDTPEKQLPQILSYLTAALTKLENEGVEVLFQAARQIAVLLPARFSMRMEQTLRGWQAHLNTNLEAQFSVGVSIALSDSGTMSLCAVLYEQAGMVLNHRLHFGPKCFLRWADVKLLPGFDGYLSLPGALLEECIRLQQADRVEQIITDHFEEFRKKGVTRAEPLQASCLEIKKRMLTVLQTRGLTEENLMRPDDEEVHELPQYVTVDGYETWARELCTRMFRQAELLEGHLCSKEVMRAADYILCHYSQNISLEEVAQMVGKSKNYFSSVFKKEMGMSFVDYILYVRIAQARRLLDTTDQLTYEIAEQVGFGDYKYFSAAFKKSVGCSPSQYRKLKEQQR